MNDESYSHLNDLCIVVMTCSYSAMSADFPVKLQLSVHILNFTRVFHAVEFNSNDCTC